ncbi:hypothetical protein C0Q70_08890 [Pomacea canaliculata]|uniref:Ig-like domain-containing protein n=1 Tax=Pomacea canaliculata TaxID=400727 RepID=A0A2T7P881_POMCA|nr:hypothetical protein C0Q70_08890 [Pomacea canaliculata]
MLRERKKLTSRGARVSKRVLNTEGEGAGSGLGSRKLFFKNRNFRTVTVAARHDSIVLDCEAAGSPVPTIHWLKDGERIVQGNFETLEDDVASLEDMETESEEAGDKLRLSSTKSRLYLDCLNSAARASTPVWPRLPT